MLWKHFSLFLVASSLAIAVAAEGESATIQLTKDTFDEELKSANFFVKFYAPW